jgi:hypothetical protein
MDSSDLVAVIVEGLASLGLFLVFTAQAAGLRRQDASGWHWHRRPAPRQPGEANPLADQWAARLIGCAVALGTQVFVVAIIAWPRYVPERPLLVLELVAACLWAVYLVRLVRKG